MAGEEILRTEGLCKSYATKGGSHRALDRLTLHLERGEIFGFLGPNGAGKSTTIRILLGLLRASSGSAHVFERDCWQRSLEIRARCGYLAGDARFYGHLTGAQHLDLLARLRAVPCRYDEFAERLGLPLDRRVKGYSKGMRQKLGIVQAVMHRPELLILDEPTSGLDPLMQEEVLVLLRELRDEGTTIFFSSHVLSEVQKVCDRTALIRAGRLLSEAALEDDLRVSRVRLRTGADVESRLRGAGYELERTAGEWRFHHRGEVEPLLEALRGLEIESLRIESPSLEEVFLESYRERDP